ncbi:MAG TPA: glycosyltransferase family 2 protein [Candidatus Nanoarchaeia archaeon]|nr:glycosyltransferase family 2 protein [Candidatus Nanoarchaeia archaeon]
MIIVTIPAYNEEKSIGRVITDIKQVMSGKKYKILVVDDGSKDRTAQVARKLGAVVYSHPKNYGLAEAFRSEVAQCLKLGADVIVHTDADGQYRAKDIPLLLRGIEEGYDLVLGSRFKGKIEYMPLLNRMGNIAFSRVISSIVGMRITDGQTGFRAFTKEVAQKIDLRSSHTYTQEQIIRAVMHKFRIKEVPIYFGKRAGQSRLIKHPLDYAFKAWVNIIRTYRDYEPLKFFGRLSMTMIVPGVIIGLWLLVIFLDTGRMRHIGSAILSVLLIMVGIQTLLFGLLADMKKTE